MNYRYSSLMDYVKPSPVAEMLHFSADPTLISFAGGMPDATIFPVEELRAAFDRALAEKEHRRCSIPRRRDCLLFARKSVSAWRAPA